MWTPWFIAAFVTGIITVIICIFSYIFPSRKITLFLRMAFDAVSIINGIFIYFATGTLIIFAVVATDAIGMARDVIFLCRGKYKWADNILVLIGFQLVFFASIFFTWEGFLSALPVIGSLINNYGLWLRDIKKQKIISVIGQIFFIVYYSCLINDSSALTLISLIASTTFLVSAIAGLVVIEKKRLQNLIFEETNEALDYLDEDER